MTGIKRAVLLEAKTGRAAVLAVEPQASPFVEILPCRRIANANTERLIGVDVEGRAVGVARMATAAILFEFLCAGDRVSGAGAAVDSCDARLWGGCGG